MANESDMGGSPGDEVDDSEVRDALAAGVPEIYANSFSNFLSSADIVTVLERNARPVAMLNLPFPVAKAYAIYLLDLVRSYEESVGQEVRIPASEPIVRKET